VRIVGVAGALVFAGWAHSAAVEPVLDTRSLDDAVATGQARIESQRATFHAPYRRVVGVPPVDSVDVVTPFRRIVLAAERQARAGGRLFSHRQAYEVLEREGNGLDLVVELTFHPHHTMVGVPDYEIVLATAGGETLPDGIDRQPRHGQSVDGQPRASREVPDRRRAWSLPLTGAIVTARFEAAVAREPGMVMVIREAGAVLVEVPMDFSGLR
jgi:hypothetical protein